MGNAPPETQLISVRWTLPTLLMMNYLKANLISNFRLPTPVRAGLSAQFWVVSGISCRNLPVRLPKFALFHHKLKKTKIPHDLIHRRDIVFTRGRQRPLKMDILHSKILPETPMPALIWIHGGAWLEGNKEQGIELLLPFARQGYLCASIEYRLSHEAIFPAQIEDCKCAVRFLRAHAKELHLNRDRIGVWGQSAGGHLAALLGTTGGVEELEGEGGWENFSSRVQAVCDWFAPTDFTRINDFPRQISHSAVDAPEALLIGGTVAENQEKAMRANPIAYINQDAPPFAIFHADDDFIVPLNQSQLLFEALQQAGVEVSLKIVKGGGHGKKFDSPLLLAQLENFFHRHLY
jgi:acetyl esterase/lipase